MSQIFLFKEDHEGDTNEKNRNTYKSWSDNDNFVKKLDNEKEYKGDD